MPYYSGTANDWAALLSALRTACTSEGWSLAGNVLHKGATYVKCHVASLAEVWAEHSDPSAVLAGDVVSLFIRAANGVGAGNALIDPAPSSFRVGGQRLLSAIDVLDCIPFTFPVHYEVHVHTNPDEVYLVVHHDVDRTQYLAFGHNPLAAATGGSGCWASASLHMLTSVRAGGAPPNPGFYCYSQSLRGEGVSNSGYQAPSAPCFNSNSHLSVPGGEYWSSLEMGRRSPGSSIAYRTITHSIHHGVDEPGWSGAANLQANVSVTAMPKLDLGVSPIDGSVPLIRPIASILRPDNKISSVAQFEHYRLVRIDHMLPRQVLALGPDRWMVYPWHRRSPDGSAPLGGRGGIFPHTGYLGWAVRYDGP